MKTTLALLSLFIATSAFAGPAECFRSAVQNAIASTDDAVSLCRGAQNLGPVECIQALRYGNRRLNFVGWTDQQKVFLCAGATDASPVDCAGQVTDMLGADQIVKLCGIAEQ